uniref:Uncharacterized protein n=1 Tax=Daucus carota subsp. sativus TaxID=79200 RepID=A0A175YLW5_DAUCS
MTKKPPSSRSPRRALRFGWKLLILLTLALCIFGLHRILNLTSQLTPPRSPTRISARFYTGNPKLAFLFLVRRDLPLDFLWQAFFEVGWGESSMIQAERLLLGAALEDPANRRFILLSDSCVPLYNFSHIYEYLMASPKSFVDSFLDKNEGRYNPKMSPVIPKGKWRKGSQWIALVREHAEVVADDETILPVFRRFCKRRPPVDVSKGKLNSKIQKQHNCIPDEHYVQTLLAMSDLEGELERRTVTYTSWNQSATKMETKGWHPFTFSYANAGPHEMQKIKDINHVYYETEYRTEWCSNNSTLVTCFLFARKFSRGAAMRLLSDGVVGRFDVSVLLSNSEP